MAAASADDREVELLLQIPNVSFDEIVHWTRRCVADSIECTIVSIFPTAAEIDQAVAQYKVSSTSVQPGKPLVFVICGDHKFPLVPSVVATRSNPYDYVFQVPNATLGLRLATQTSREIVEAFEWIVRTYGVLTEGATPPPPSSTAPMAMGGAAAAAGVATGAYVAQAYAPPVYVPTVAPPAVPADPNVYVMPRIRQPMMLQVAPDAPPPPVSTRIAGGIGKVAGYVTAGLATTSTYVARGIDNGSTAIVQNTAACERPVEVPSIIKTNVARSRTVTKGALLVSTGVAAAMIGLSGVISDGVASSLRPTVQAQAAQPESATVHGLKEVGLATAGAGLMIFDAAANAGKTLLAATSSGVSRVVGHKLGAEAGAVTQDGFGIVEDGVASAINMQNAGVKGVLANTVKQTAQKTFT